MAKFEKGKPRPANAGRKKGSKNKTTCFIEACGEFKLNILACLVDDLKDTPPFQRVDVWLKLLEFYFPKKKQTDVGNVDGQGFTINIRDYSALAKK